MQVSAVITRSNEQGSFVKITHPAGGCGRCDEQGGCQSGILGQLFGSACREYRVIDELSFPVGSQVVVEVPDGIPIRAAFIAYMLPLILILAFAFVLHELTYSEIYAAGGAVFGGFMGWYIVRVLKQQGVLDVMRPRVVRLIAES